MHEANSRCPMRLAAVMFAVVTGGGVAPAAADRLVPFGTFGAWKVNAVLDPSNRLTRCIASGRYKSGVYFAIVFSVKEQFWYLQFFDPSWPERSGRSAAKLSVDGALVSTTSILWRKRSAYLSLGRSVDSVVRLMKGQQLAVETTAGRSVFRLDGSFGATSKVVDCVRRYRGATTASPGGGAFGPGAGAATSPPDGAGKGAFGVAPGRPATQPDWKLPRADTLQYAVTYLDKRGVPYRILPETKQIFRHLPVNWMYNSRAYGGMIAFRRGRLSGSDALGIVIGSHTRICDIKSAIVRDKPQVGNGVTTLKAKGACEATKGNYLAEFSVIERDGKAVFMIVEMLDKTPRANDKPAAPAGNKPRLPPGVQEG